MLKVNLKDTHNSITRVAIQGVAGCFHDAAARGFFSQREIETVECDSFPEMFQRLEDDASLLAIMAIENTVAGSLLPNHELLLRSRAKVIGEYKMRISHTLAAMPGQTLDDLHEVHSHQMALRQCENFLRRHTNLRKVEAFDTAGSARDIAADGSMGVGAICSGYAAKLYGLEVLASEIETNKRNFTRFLVLADPLTANSFLPPESEIHKSSMVITLKHEQGALSKVLTILSFYDINLTKIQSMPILGREWEYRFYIDVEFESYIRYRQSIEAVAPLTNELRILGEYKICSNEV